MAGVNKVILIGNLGADPEVRHLSNGSVVANFNMATSESYTTKNGEKVTQTEWHRIELWDGLAKIAEQYLKKGRTVFIEGKLKTDSWQDNDGNQRSTTRIRGYNMQLLGGRGEYSDNQGSNNSSYQNQTNTQNAPVSNSSSGSYNEEISLPDDSDGDDLPF